MKLLQTPAAGFDAPIDILLACHEKVRRFCLLLDRLPEYIDKNGCDLMVQEAAAQILRYFNQAAPLHHADEETDYFPLLMRVKPDTRSAIQQLTTQHQALHTLWLHVQAILTALPEHPATNMAATFRAFTHAYEEHMQQEEPLLHLGCQVIPPLALQHIGQRMAHRRGQNIH